MELPHHEYRYVVVQEKDQQPQIGNEEDMDSAGINAESVVAGMAAPLQALRELLLWPVMYSKEAASLGLRVPLLPFAFRVVRV